MGQDKNERRQLVPVDDDTACLRGGTRGGHAARRGVCLLYTSYCDWGLHDELSDNKGLDCDMALQAVDTIEQIRKQGFSFDYYLMDAFWFEPDQPYTTFKESSFPQGITPLLERLDQCGMKFGLWFDVNFAHEHLSGYRALRRDRSDNQQLCFSQPETAKMMENALLKHVRESRIKMIKFDFAYFECCNSAHQNHSGEHLESKEPAIRNFINVLDKVRREEPEMTVLAYNGFTAGLEWIGSVYERRQGYAISPWWCLYIDYLYCGDPRPADFAADLLNHSITAYTDAMIYQFRQALIPFEFIDDHGSMVASTATMYWLRRRGMRDYLLMNVMRTTCKIHFYGDIHEVTHEDVDFLKWCNEKALDIETKQMHNSFILGNPLRGEVYGYSITNGREGYIVLSNPTGEVRRSLLSLDEW